MLGRDVEPIANKPLGIIDLLDGSFAALRQRARVLVIIVAGLAVPSSLLQGWVTRNDLGGASFGELLSDPALAEEASSPTAAYDAEFFLSQILLMFVTAVTGVGVAWVINAWFEGRDPGALDALRFTLRRAGAIIVAFVVIHLLQLLGMILLLIPGLVLVVLSSLTSPVLAIEGLGPIASMRRSWELTRRRAGPVVIVLMLLFLVQLGLSQAITTLPSTAALFVGLDRAWPLVSLSTMVTQLIFLPVNAAAMALLYLDIRFRTEGLDLRRRMFLDLPPVEGTP
ncbi:MAG: hypothetical protein AAF962_01945 [Actinomycetota bacterium]